MSIASNFPAIKPSLNLDFANVQQLDPRVTFSRASSATYYGTETAKAEQNLLLQSQDFTTTWTNSGTTETADTTVAPDGTTTADTVTASAGAAVHNMAQAVATTATQTVFSVFAKAGTHNYIQLRFAAAAGGAFCNFDITAGAGAVGTSTSATGTITSVGNDWYRCSILATPSVSTGGIAVFLVSSSSAAGAESWTALGTETVILWGAQLEQRSAVTAYMPTTTQPITNYIPVLESAAAGVSRFDHNPTTFESLGLLIEEQRTNTATFSQAFTNAVYLNGPDDVTVADNAAVSVDGTINATTYVEGTASATHARFQRVAGLTANGSYTLSLIVKNNSGGRGFALGFGSNALGTAALNSANRGFARWNTLATGAATATGVSGTGSVTSSNAVALGNNWFRLTVTFVFDTGNTMTSFAFGFGITDVGLASATTGDGSSYTIYGFQLEAGAFATSYIPTVAASATRSADVATMTGANFSNWYNQSEGTLFADATPQASTAEGYALIEAGDGTDNNRIGLFKLVTSGNASLSVRDSNVQQVSTNSGAWTVTGKLAGAYKLNDFASSFNGGAVATDTSGTVPVVNQLTIGRRQSGANVLTGTIRRIAYYPLRVTNAQLQALTG